MTDHTQQQTGDARRRAKELSLKSTAPPIEVPGYETQKFLGSGAFGEVWVAINRNTGRRVAIKFYTHRGSVDWTLLSREVEKLAVLAADRYVVQLLDVGWDSDPPYYVMDYIENGSLEDLLRAKGALPVHQALDIFREVAVGLMHLHGKGVLHCDLKPANVLLDAEEKPRLADFGQSRLSHEQQPALGTLFYMAPEQADLEAVPDARWDVYALGALFYSMLTGAPPFRTESVTSQLDSSNSLAGRLAKYREAIKSESRPDQHRRVPGLDRGLVEVIDRCLAVDPEHRFANVQSVLDALQQRDEARHRTPLLILGVVAPIILLAVMVYFGVTNTSAAVDQANQAVISHGRQTNKYVANSEARAIRHEFDRFFAAARNESRQDDLSTKLRNLLADGDIQKMLAELNVPNSRQDEVKQARDRFLGQAKRIELDEYLKERISYRKAQLDEDPQAIRIASMFVVDRNGTMLAVAYEDPRKSKSEGRNYSFRTYFHGQAEQLPKDTPTNDIEPVKDLHLSGAFQSSTTGTWKIGVSQPLILDDQLRGVLVLTLELMHFTPFRDGQDSQDQFDHFAVLVDGRQEQGTILYHPFLTATTDNVRGELAKKEYRVDLAQFARHGDEDPFIYRDPVGDHQEGTAFERDWLAAISEVTLSDGTDTGLRVIVQENYQASVKPLATLRNVVLQRVAYGSTVFLLVIAVEWYFVMRVMGAFRGPEKTEPKKWSDSLHSMETISAPSRPNPVPDTIKTD